MKEEKKVKFGWGTDEEHCERDTYDTVEELLKYAQASWDDMDGDPFDEDLEYSGCIYVGTAETFTVSDFAPSLDNIADQITDSFYCEHNVDECVDAQIYHRKEAEEAWKEFVEKYFELPAGINITTTWNVGVYSLKEHKWVEKYSKFEKYVENK